MARIQPQFESVQVMSITQPQGEPVNYVSGSAILFIRGNPTDDVWNREDISFEVPSDGTGNAFTIKDGFRQDTICSVWPGTFQTESGVDIDHGWGVDTFSTTQEGVKTIINARIVVRGRHATMVRIGFLAVIPGMRG
jgi:hypothetical protein